MSDPARKPLAAVPMESRDERVTIRLTSRERAEWQAAARARGEEESRFIRRCAIVGRKVLEARVFSEQTGA
jgi:uncharacterized protein (DUF1778 family)